MKKLRFSALLALIFFSSLSLSLPAQDSKTAAQEADRDIIIDQVLNRIEAGQIQVPSPEIPAVEPAVTEKPKLAPALKEAAQVPAPAKEDAGAINPAVAAAGKKKIIIDVLELKDMDILDAMKLISKKSGLNIVASKNVRGKVTIFLKDVDVWDALNIILETNELAYEQEENIIKVMTDKEYELTYGRRFADKTQTVVVALKFADAPDLIPILTQMKSIVGRVMADEKSNTIVLMDAPSRVAEMQNLIKEIDVPIITKIFELNYSKAEDMEKKITEVLTKNIGRVKVDVRSNKMFVTDTPLKMAEVEKIITAFDEKHMEVLIEAKIVQVTLNDEFKMGVNWEAVIKKYKSLDLKSAFTILTDIDKRGQLTIGNLGSDNYEALVQALDTVGTTNTLSSPRITALNNEEAKIMVGSTQPYVTTTTTTPSSGPTTTAEAVNFIDVGVKLYVTPTINKDNYITMKIRPEVSSADTSLITSQNNKIPIVSTSVAETKVMVKDGSTIVIGGLIKDVQTDTVNKVPILGDIPLIGLFFRNKDKVTNKVELVIFLTPRIIYGDDSFNSKVTSIKSGK